MKKNVCPAFHGSPASTVVVSVWTEVLDQYRHPQTHAATGTGTSRRSELKLFSESYCLFPRLQGRCINFTRVKEESAAAKAQPRTPIHTPSPPPPDYRPVTRTTSSSPTPISPPTRSPPSGQVPPGPPPARIPPGLPCPPPSRPPPSLRP